MRVMGRETWESWDVRHGSHRFLDMRGTGYESWDIRQERYVTCDINVMGYESRGHET